MALIFLCVMFACEQSGRNVNVDAQYKSIQRQQALNHYNRWKYILLLIQSQFVHRVALSSS